MHLPVFSVIRYVQANLQDFKHCQFCGGRTACILHDYFTATLMCEAPNNRISEFEGRLVIDKNTLPVGNDQVLLRGCRLRNTKWCFGVVVFAGRDTKLMMNSGKTIFKRTSMDAFLNQLIVGVRKYSVLFSRLKINRLCLTLPGFLVNKPRGVLLKVPFFDLQMSAENRPRGVFSRSRQVTVVTS